MERFGFIGTGNMGGAMLAGALGCFGQDAFIFYDAVPEARKRTSEQYQIVCAKSNAALAGAAKYVVLAVKPQMIRPVLEEIKPALTAESVVMSIAAGISIAELKEHLGERRIVRAMPNTAAMAGEAMTGVALDESIYTEEEKEKILNFFRSFGKCELIPESLMNAVICASGSSPAYVYMFIEALADSAVRAGMARSMAYTMSAQAVLGAAKMVLETGRHPGELKDAVCSPAGTTIAGVAALEKYGFRNAVLQAGAECLERAKELDKAK